MTILAASSTPRKPLLSSFLDLVRPDLSAAELAAELGASRSHAHGLVQRLQLALTPLPPGPSVGFADLSRSQRALDEVRAELAATKAQLLETQKLLDARVEVTQRRLDQLQLVLTHHHVPTEGVSEVLAVAFGEQHAPSRSSVHAFLQRAGRAAVGLMTDLRTQLAPSLTTLAGDDIFLHRCPVKVLLEPDSQLILRTQRWPWHKGEDWALWLSEFPRLDLFVSDLGSDLVAACEELNVLQMADFFHEVRWWDEHVLTPLSQHELKARQQLETEWARAVRVKGPGRRLGYASLLPLFAAVDRAEQAFFDAMTAVAMVEEFYQPLAPSGHLWSTSDANRQYERLKKALARLPEPVRGVAERHVSKHGAKYETHRAALDAVPVDVREGSGWTRRRVLDEVVALRALRAQDGQGAVGKAIRRQVQRRKRALARGCLNVKAVEAALERYLRRPPRSSSSVEAFNARIRVAQQVHRRVSDEHLALLAWAWNGRLRSQGPHKGTCPLHRVQGKPAEPENWYDQILDRLAA